MISLLKLVTPVSTRDATGYVLFSTSENSIEVTKKDEETMTVDDFRLDELTNFLEQEKIKNSNLTTEFENSTTCLKQQNDINVQLSLQLKEKESVIEILRSSSTIRRSSIGLEKDTSEDISDHDVFCEQEKSETQISEKNSQFLRLMTEKVCPSDLNEETLNLKIDDVVSELAESLPKIGQFCISYLIRKDLGRLNPITFSENSNYRRDSYY